ncbi:MAG TPA: hypothetical protein VF745_05985 [Steroidobacteraceae bacterium]
MAEPLPALFIGHGNPMNALQVNTYTKAWRRIGQVETLVVATRAWLAA